MKKLLIVLVTLFSVNSFAGEPLPATPGKLSDARVSRCDTKLADETIKKYGEALFALEGVDGMGHTFMEADETVIFNRECTAINLYINMDYEQAIRAKVGYSLDGSLVTLSESGGPGRIQ